MKKVSEAKYVNQSWITDEHDAILEDGISFVYKSNTQIGLTSYSGDIQKIKLAKNISDEFKESLLLLNCMSSVGGQFKSIHLYSNRAEFLDGSERICYINQKNEGELLVSEYYGRGSRYSAYYRILLKKLSYTNEFQIRNGKIIVTLSNVNLFVQTINEIVSLPSLCLYRLENDCDRVMIENVPHYFHKIYWYSKEDYTELSKPESSVRKVYSIRLYDKTVERLDTYLKEYSTQSNDQINRSEFIEYVITNYFETVEGYHFIEMDEKYKQIIENLDRINLCVVGRDPFPNGATTIPFCKETWNEQYNKNQAGYSIVVSLGENTASFASPKEYFYDLASRGIVFLNASYAFLNKESISKVKHYHAVASSYEINKPILKNAKKVLLTGDSWTMLGWIDSNIYSDEKYVKVPHPSPQARNRSELKSEWDKYWSEKAIKKMGY